MSLRLLFLLFIVSFNASNAQVLCGKILSLNSVENKLYLRDQVGLNFSFVDSVIISNEGNFSFRARKYPCGYYQIQLNSDTNRADIILNPIEDTVRLILVKDKLIDGLNVVKSQENISLWAYKRTSRVLTKKEMEVRMLQNQTAVNDAKMRAQLNVELENIQNKKLSELVNIVGVNPELFFSKVAKSSVSLKRYQSKQEQKKHFFDHVDFKNSDLIRSTVFTNVLFEYLTKYTEYTEAGFKNSLDTLLLKASANNLVYDFCLDYLLTLFNKTGPEVVFDYLVESYLLKDACSEVNVSNMFKQTITEYRNVMVGNTIENFSITDVKGDKVFVKNIAEKSAYTLLFFWSSHCQFCHEAITQLTMQEKNLKKRNIVIIPISIDKEKAELEKFLNENKLPWKVYNESSGWDSEMLKKLKIHRTPGLLVIDNTLKISAKPLNYQEFYVEFVKK